MATHEITENPTRHRLILHRVICGQTLAYISRETGIFYSTLKLIVRCPAFKKEVERLQREIAGKVIENLAAPKQYLNQKAIKAARRLVRLMENSKSENFQLTNANSTLDRAGPLKINKVEGEVTQVVYIDNCVTRLLLVSKMETGLIPEEQRDEVAEAIERLDAAIEGATEGGEKR